MGLPNYPVCSIRPPPRCSARQDVVGPLICGELAGWLRRGNKLFEDLYFCDAHAEPSDVVIPACLVVRRVRLEIHVLFAGVGASAVEAHVEAVARLETAIAAAGGCLQVDRVMSALVRYGPLPAVGDGGRS